MTDKETEQRLRSLLADERARRAWLEEQLAAEKAKGTGEKQRVSNSGASSSTHTRRLLALLRARPSGRDGSKVQKAPSDSGGVDVAEEGPLHPATTVVADAPMIGLFDPIFKTIDSLDASARDVAGADLIALDSSLDGSRTAEMSRHLMLEGRPPVLLASKGARGHQCEAWLVDDDVIVNGSDLPGSPIQSVSLLQPAKSAAREVEVCDGIERGLAPNGDIVWASPTADADQSRLAALVAGSGVPVVELEANHARRPEISPEEVRKATVRTRRWLFRSYSPWAVGDRLAPILPMRYPESMPSVAAILVSNRPQMVERALAQVLAFDYRPLEVVVGIHGADKSAFKTLKAKLESVDARISLVSFGSERSLGWCLNNAVELTGAQILAKIDDDDHYGPGYLTDAVLSLLYSRADMTGKGARYVYLEPTDSTYLMSPALESRWVDYVPGPSIVVRRRAWERVKFAHRHSRVDSTFVAGVRSVGMKIWSSTRDELVIERRHSGHTWEADPSFFEARGHKQWKGRDIAAAFVNGTPEWTPRSAES